MESFDMFLNGNFVAIDAFKKHFGVLLDDGKYAIPTRWQSALFQAGQCGAFIGVFLAGPVTDRIGYRWTTILSLILMNATIFISFFVRYPLCMLILALTRLRQTRSKCSSSVKLLRVFHGASSSPIRLHMRVRSFLWPCEGPARQHFRCAGLLVASSLQLRRMPTIKRPVRRLGGYLLLCSGSSP